MLLRVQIVVDSKSFLTSPRTQGISTDRFIRWAAACIRHSVQAGQVDEFRVSDES